MLSSEALRLTRVVVSTPLEEYYKADDLAAHNILETADPAVALAQHGRLKELLAGAGAQVVDVKELAGHPNSVFTRDASLCTPRGYVKLLPGIATRRDEGAWMAAELDLLAEPCVGEISAPGTVDGGDVVLMEGTAFVGLTRRTNRQGCAQLAEILAPMGYETRGIPLPDHILHLDKVLMPMAPDRLVACTNVVPENLLGGFAYEGVEFDDLTTANIICLGEGEFIVGESNATVIELLEQNGNKVHALDISEFVKGAGGPNCLVMPLERK